jgi:hypothetical protein
MKDAFTSWLRTSVTLIAEAELLFRNRHWARAAGLAMYAGEEAIKFDSLKKHPETTTHNHASRGKVCERCQGWMRIQRTDARFCSGVCRNWRDSAAAE